MDNVIRNILEFQERGLGNLERANRALQDVSSTSRWTAFTSSITAANAALSLFTPVVGAAQSAVEKMVAAGIRVESTRLTWKGLLGDMQAAQVRMDEINRFAANAPFTKLGIEAAAIQMQALNKYSLQALTAMGNLAAAFPGRTIQEATEAALGATRMEFDPLERFGINKQMIAQEIGIAAADVHAETAKEVERIWDATVAIIQRKHGTMMTELMNSTQGQITNLQDAMNRAWEQMGKGTLSPVGDGVQVALKQINQMLDDGTFQRAGEAIGGVLSGALKFVAEMAEKLSVQGSGPSAVAARERYMAQHPPTYMSGAYRALGNFLDWWVPPPPTPSMGMGGLHLREFYQGSERAAAGAGAAIGSTGAGSATSGSATGGRSVPAGSPWAQWGPLGPSDYGPMGYGPEENPYGPPRGRAINVHEEQVSSARSMYKDLSELRAADLADAQRSIDQYMAGVRIMNAGVQGMAGATSRVVSGFLLKEHVDRMKGVDIAKYVASQTAGAVISGIAQEATAQAGKQIALALGSFPNGAAMAAHFASAAKWGLLGGIAGGVGAALTQGSQESFDRSQAATYSGADQGNAASTRTRAASSNGIRALNAAAGPTSVTYMVNVTYQGAVIYGSGGTREWFQRELLPLIQEARAMGEAA